MNDHGPLLRMLALVGVTLGLAAGLIGSTLAIVTGWIVIGGIVLGIVAADWRARKQHRQERASPREQQKR